MFQNLSFYVRNLSGGELEYNILIIFLIGVIVGYIIGRIVPKLGGFKIEFSKLNKTETKTTENKPSVSEATTVKNSNNVKTDLSKNSWYRAVQIFYLLGFILLTAIFLPRIYNYFKLNPDEPMIRCLNGRIYTVSQLENNGIGIRNNKGIIVSLNHNEKIRQICGTRNPNNPFADNYQTSAADHETYWPYIALATLAFFAAILIALEIIRRAIFYIITNSFNPK